jgi:hypothetical protein
MTGIRFRGPLQQFLSDHSRSVTFAAMAGVTLKSKFRTLRGLIDRSLTFNRAGGVGKAGVLRSPETRIERPTFSVDRLCRDIIRDTY